MMEGAGAGLRRTAGNLPGFELPPSPGRSCFPPWHTGVQRLGSDPAVSPCPGCCRSYPELPQPQGSAMLRGLAQSPAKLPSGAEAKVTQGKFWIKQKPGISVQPRPRPPNRCCPLRSLSW